MGPATLKLGLANVIMVSPAIGLAPALAYRTKTIRAKKNDDQS